MKLEKLKLGCVPYFKRNAGAISFFAAAVFFIFMVYGRINMRAYWIDEAFTANITRAGFLDFLKKVYTEGHPPFYTFLVKVWAGLFGDGEAALRSFSALCALLLIVFTYKTASFIFGDKKTGCIAVWLAATNYLLIWFSVQTRPYVFAAMMGLLSFYYLIKVVFKPKRSNLFLYTLITALAVYSHFFMILLFVAQVLLLLIFWKSIKSSYKILIADLLIVVLTIPNTIITLSQTSQGAPSWVGRVSFTAFFDTYKYLSYGSATVLLIFSVIALFYYLYNQPELRLAYDPTYKAEKTIKADLETKLERKITLWALFLYCLFPVIVAVVLSQFKPFYVTARYETTVLPAFVLILSFWISNIKSKLLVAALAISLMFTAFSSVRADRKAVSGYRSNNRTVARGIYDQLSQRDAVIAVDINLSTFKYYLTGFAKDGPVKVDLISFPQEISAHPGWKDDKKMMAEKSKYQSEASNLSDKLKETIDDGGKVWLIYRDSPINRLLYNELSRNFEIDRIERPAEPREPSWFESVIIMRK